MAVSADPDETPGAGPPLIVMERIVVVACDDLGSGHNFEAGNGAYRHQLAIAVANVDPQDIGNVGAAGCVSLHVYLPGAPIKVEIIHVDAAERGLQRGKYVAYIKAERLRLARSMSR
jgi:hypothetical protein